MIYICLLVVALQTSDDIANLKRVGSLMHYCEKLLELPYHPKESMHESGSAEEASKATRTPRPHHTVSHPINVSFVLPALFKDGLVLLQELTRPRYDSSVSLHTNDRFGYSAAQASCEATDNLPLLLTVYVPGLNFSLRELAREVVELLTAAADGAKALIDASDRMRLYVEIARLYGTLGYHSKAAFFSKQGGGLESLMLKNLYEKGAYTTVYWALAPNSFETNDQFVAGPQIGVVVPHESNPFGPFESSPDLMMAQPKKCMQIKLPASR
ncbi:TRAPP II complex, Trs120 [Artemisia annua]|uniref:TRAPP II complex, Trs120 n=1 Tax=Artemisia annua TaxID=35608 RepID=A0A2U1PFJ9_ARTAN|nr:TRAPP II complex, Trs120 [Artemisia annua]